MSDDVEDESLQSMFEEREEDVAQEEEERRVEEREEETEALGNDADSSKEEEEKEEEREGESGGEGREGKASEGGRRKPPKRGAVNIRYDSVEDRKDAFVLDFLDMMHDSLSVELMKSPEKMTLIYGQVINKLGRKYTVMLGKSEIFNIYQKLLNSGKAADSFIIESLLKNKSVRSSSGVLPISVATDGNTFSCAYDCHFCPNECVKLGAKRDISRSYLSSEGTFIRGAIEDFDPARSVWRRLIQLEMMGHPPDKCEIIVLGGTWDCYPPAYRDEFIRQIFYSCNVYHILSLRLEGPLSPLVKEWIKKRPFIDDVPFDKDGAIRSQLPPIRTLQEEKKTNETSPCARIIGIVLETRPDQINRSSLLRKRMLGCTRIQLGIQTTNDDVLEFNNRGHDVSKSVNAIRFARDACFKVDGHLMPDLPSTTLEIDYKMIQDVFCGEDLQLDYCKLYPCLDLPFTKSREWKEEGVWKPIAENNYPEFLELMCHAMACVPPWTRVNRVQRDFPEARESNEYLGYVSDKIKSNLQEEVIRRLKETGRRCRDVRCREIRTQHHHDAAESARLFIRCYRANQGTEFFISVEIPEQDGEVADDAVLMGLLRLRLPDPEVKRIKGGREGEKGEEKEGESGGVKEEKFPRHYLKEFSCRLLARVRELHVYGNIQMVEGKKEKAANMKGDQGKESEAKEKQTAKLTDGEKKSDKEPERNEGKGEREEKKQSQHTGVGKFLMAVAERVSALFGFSEISVISGVGVRTYYAKLGYAMDEEGEGEYMVKKLRVGKEGGGEGGREERGSLLPLTLFGHTFGEDDIEVPIARMLIAKQFLPPPSPASKSGNLFASGESVAHDFTPNYALLSYHGIQNGLPQLAVIKAKTQRGTPTCAPFSLHANRYSPLAFSPPPPPSSSQSSSFASRLVLVSCVLVVLLAVLWRALWSGK